MSDDVDGDTENQVGTGRGVENRSLPDTIQWAAAIVTGAVTYVVGYLFVLAFYWLGPGKLGESLSLAEQLGKTGVVFNAAQRVDVAASHPLLVVANGEQTTLGSQFDLFWLTERISGELVVPEVVYLAFPIVLLLAVGFGRAWALSKRDRPTTTVVSSLGISVGYGAVAYLGALVFSYPIGERTIVDGTAIYATQAYQISGGEITEAIVTFSSETTGTLLSGVAYPLVLAPVGAVAAVIVRSLLE